MTPGNAESRVGSVTTDGTEPGVLFSIGAESVAITSDDCYTPKWVFDAMGLRFDIDVAAPIGGPWHVPCDRYYTAVDDGLTQPWDGLVWCNPPYSSIEPWVRKAWAEHEATLGIVMLLPGNRAEQKWWQQLVEPHRDRPGSPLTVKFLPGRMRFIRRGCTDVGPNERPPFGCVLLVWRPA